MIFTFLKCLTDKKAGFYDETVALMVMAGKSMCYLFAGWVVGEAAACFLRV